MFYCNIHIKVHIYSFIHKYQNLIKIDNPIIKVNFRAEKSFCFHIRFKIFHIWIDLT